VFQARRWTRARRIVVVREELPLCPAARGLALWQVPGYRFPAIVTSLTLALEAVRRTYNGRADSENRLKELQHAFGADGCCSRWLPPAMQFCPQRRTFDVNCKIRG
jgi:hypothetical protein